ncbi:UNVERIFIED_CONTAM: retrotransposon gag domain-containing protein, partial [Salmonella enterica subsp. enterica serovar Weltevreden]
IITMVQNFAQFYGKVNEDPNDHINNFLEVCDTIKTDGVPTDTIRLKLFPFPLKHKAKHWLNSLPEDSIDTWNKLVEAFLKKYYPYMKTIKARSDIQNFIMSSTESFYEAWDQFIDLQMRCPHH